MPPASLRKPVSLPSTADTPTKGVLQVSRKVAGPRQSGGYRYPLTLTLLMQKSFKTVKLWESEQPSPRLPSPNSDFTHHKCTILPLNEPAGAGRVSGVTGCRGSVARSRGLTLAVLRRRFHPPTINFPRLHLSSPTTPARPGILSSPLKPALQSPKQQSPSPSKQLRVAPPQALCSGERVWTRTKVPPHPDQAAGETGAQTGRGGARAALGVPAPGPSATPYRRSGAPQLPFPRPHSGRRGEPAALPPAAARAAAPPPYRAGGSWLPQGPSEARLRGGLRTGPHPGTGVQTPGKPADAGTRTRRKPAELEDVPGRPRRAPPTHRTGARSRARSRQGLWGALRDAETAVWVRRLLGVFFPGGDHLVSPRQFWEDLLKDAVFGEAGGWIRRSPSLGPS